ncbi:hypothetical protein H2248_007871 [Termitomyces sp. 'cryptogamus']|nr:hypothetical protein H2248_007871 [Termitomyces sp. 'cryptogamus']
MTRTFSEHTPLPLTFPQRTLTLQTVSYILYLVLGVGVFFAIEAWSFCDDLYRADYTLLTISLDADFLLKQTVSRALLIPYAALGIMMIDLVVGRVRELILEREVVRRNLAKQRAKLIQNNGTFNRNLRRGKEEFDCMRKMERRAHIIGQYSALGTSFFASVIVWLMGALVYWFTEKARD